MAKVLGKSGRYVEDQTVKTAQRFVSYLLIALVVLSAALGALALKLYERQVTWLTLPVFVSIVALLFVAIKLTDKRLDAIERENISFRKGAVGEAIVSRILKGLPEDYSVLNDLKTEFGNIDHAVIGPTGIFVIDTKNWKGTVTPDGNGELLVNGKPTSKPEVKNLVRTVMNCREQVMTLCKSNRLDCDLYIQAVLAFPSAYVDAPFKSVKNADCLTDERLADYITDKYRAGKLNKEQTETVSQAFLALARMDKGFSDNAKNDS
jgi:hypothetical protein